MVVIIDIVHQTSEFPLMRTLIRHRLVLEYLIFKLRFECFSTIDLWFMYIGHQVGIILPSLQLTILVLVLLLLVLHLVEIVLEDSYDGWITIPFDTLHTASHLTALND